MKDLTILPFDNWKSRLMSRGMQNTNNVQICSWEIDGDPEQWMFNEYTNFPHFGEILAAGIDPSKYKAEIKSSYMFDYVDPEGKPVYGIDPETVKETGKKPKEKFEGASFEVLYYDYVIWMHDFDKACEVAYEMYKRRRKNPESEEDQ